jgi:hypothetical protein
MLYSTTELNRYANLVAHGGPAPLGGWLKAALGRFWTRSSRKALPPRDLAREAAEVRTWAESVRRTDPRFADDLFAAADRHELQGQ